MGMQSKLIEVLSGNFENSHYPLELQQTWENSNLARKTYSGRVFLNVPKYKLYCRIAKNNFCFFFSGKLRHLTPDCVLRQFFKLRKPGIINNINII